MSRIFDAVRGAEQIRAARAWTTAVHADEPATGGRVVQERSDASPSGTAAVAVMTSPADSPSVRLERRKQRRACARLAARVRPADPKEGDFTEVLETVNSSCQGLYFTTRSAHFCPRMRLRVIFPYSSMHDSVAVSEQNGVVERLESLSDRLLGVAVRFGLPTSELLAAEAQVCATSRPTGERRLAPRHLFSAGTIVSENRAKARLEARCSDLSFGGCYVDSLNPFPEGTVVHVQIQSGAKVFEGAALVCSSHMGMGMGLSFHELNSEQKTVMAHWLGEK